MPTTYEYTDKNGTRYRLESHRTDLTPDQVEAEILAGPVKPEGTVKSFLRSAAMKAVPAVGTLLGGIGGGAVGTVVGSPTGPGAVVPAIAGTIAVGTAGGALASKAQSALLRNIYGDYEYQRMLAQEKANERVHNMASAMGGLVGDVPAMFSGTGVAKAAPILAKAPAIVAKALETATAFSTMEASHKAQEGGSIGEIARSAAEGGITGGVLSFVPHAKSLLQAVTARPASEALIMATAQSLFDAQRTGKQIDPLEIAQQTVQNFPAFAVMGAGGHLMRGKTEVKPASKEVKPLETLASKEQAPEVKVGEKLPSEEIQTLPGLSDEDQIAYIQEQLGKMKEEPPGEPPAVEPPLPVEPPEPVATPPVAKEIPAVEPVAPIEAPKPVEVTPKAAIPPAVEPPPIAKPITPVEPPKPIVEPTPAETPVVKASEPISPEPPVTEGSKLQPEPIPQPTPSTAVTGEPTKVTPQPEAKPIALAPTAKSTSTAKPVKNWRVYVDGLTDDFQKQSGLRAIAEVSKSDNELRDILDRVEKLPEGLQSEVAWEVANKPAASDATFERAVANPELRMMTTDENIEGLRQKRAARKPTEAKPVETPTTGDAVKESWQMTQAEWIEKRQRDRATEIAELKALPKRSQIKQRRLEMLERLQASTQNAAEGHLFQVQQAISEGKPVPPEVLAEYPDLQKGAPTGEATNQPVETGQGGVPYYRKLGGQDALDPDRKRMRSVPQNYKLAYLSGWYEAKKAAKTEQPTPTAPALPAAKPIEKPSTGKPVKAAYRLDDGKIETGKSHAEILMRLGKKVPTSAVREKQARFGFVDEQGNWMDRQQAAEALGLDRPAHSSDLPSEQAERPTVPAPVGEPPLKESKSKILEEIDKHIEKALDIKQVSKIVGRNLEGIKTKAVRERGPLADLSEQELEKIPKITIKTPGGKITIHNSKEALTELRNRIAGMREPVPDKPRIHTSTARAVEENYLRLLNQRLESDIQNVEIKEEIKTVKKRLEDIKAGKKVFFTEEAKNAAVERLKKRGQQAGMGVDPGYIRDLAEIGGYHFERGVRNLTEWAQTMVREVGEWVRPHLAKVWSELKRLYKSETGAIDIRGSGEYQKRYSKAQAEIEKLKQLPSTLEREARITELERKSGIYEKRIVKSETVQKAETIKQRINQITAPTEQLGKAISLAEALKRKYAYAEKVSAAAYETGAAQKHQDIKALAGEAQKQITELRDAALREVDEKLGSKEGGPIFRKMITSLLKPIDAAGLTENKLASLIFDRISKAERIHKQVESKADTLERREHYKTVSTILKSAFSKGAAISPEVKVKLREMMKDVNVKTMTTDVLRSLANRMKLEEEAGRQGYRTDKQIGDAKHEIVMGQLLGVEDVNKFSSAEKVTNPDGSPLNWRQEVLNRARKMQELMGRANKNIQTISAIFAQADGGWEKKGGLTETFKLPIVENRNTALQLYNEHMNPVKEMVKQLGLTKLDRIRISDYGHLQDGARENLEAMGRSKKYLDNLTLDDKQMQVYQAMRKVLNATGKMVQKTAADVHNDVIEVQDKYWPRIVDREAYRKGHVEKRGEAIPKEVKELEGFDNLTAHERMKIVHAKDYFTKERTGSALPFKEMDALELIDKHVEDVTHYAANEADLVRLSRLASDPRFKDKYGDITQEFTLDWLDTVSRQGGRDGQIRSKALMWINRNITRGMVGFRYVNQLKHSSSLPILINDIGINAFQRGAVKMYSPEGRSFLDKYVPELKARGGPDPGYQLRGKIDTAAFSVARLTDRELAGAAILGSYLKRLEAVGIDVKSGEEIPFHSKDLAWSVETAHRSVASVLVEDRPQFATRGGDFKKGVSLFQNYLMERWSRWQTDFYQFGIKDKNPAIASRQAAALVVSSLMHGSIRIASGATTAGLAYALFGTSPEDQKKKIPNMEQFAHEVGMDIIYDAPGGSQVRSILRGETGVPALDVSRELVEQVTGIGKAKTPTTTKRAVVKAATSAAALAGIPGSGQVGSTVLAGIPESHQERLARLRRERKELR